MLKTWWIFYKNKGAGMKKLLVIPLIGLLSVAGCITPSKSVVGAPTIATIKWGEVVIAQDGKEAVYNESSSKDVILSPSGSQPWDWSKTDMHHKPGIRVQDVQASLNLQQIDVVVLSRGMYNVLQVPQETVDWLKDQGKEVHVGQSEDMAKKYNELVEQGKKVGGLFHSTC